MSPAAPPHEQGWLASTIEACADPLVEVDRAGRVVAANSRAGGLGGRRGPLGRRLDTLVVPAVPARDLLLRVAAGEVLTGVPARRADGAAALLTVSPVHEGGAVVGALVVVREGAASVAPPPDGAAASAAGARRAAERLLPVLVRGAGRARRDHAALVGHQARTARLAAAVARGLGLDEDGVGAVRLAASVHDVGTLVLPRRVLGHRGPLTAADLALVRTHSRAGHDVVADAGLPAVVATAVLQHHERLDGSGYPAGLRRDEIDLPARVVAVADVLGAMTAPRPHRPARSLGDAMRELLEGRDRRYDADVVDVCREVCLHDGVAVEDLTPAGAPGPS